MSNRRRPRSGQSSSHSRDDPSSRDESLPMDRFSNLVLKRGKGESIIISHDGIPIVRITVVDHATKLACESLPDHDIDRESIFLDKLSANPNLTTQQKERIEAWIQQNPVR